MRFAGDINQNQFRPIVINDFMWFPPSARQIGLSWDPRPRGLRPGGVESYARSAIKYFRLVLRAPHSRRHTMKARNRGNMFRYVPICGRNEQSAFFAWMFTVDKHAPNGRVRLLRNYSPRIFCYFPHSDYRLISRYVNINYYFSEFPPLKIPFRLFFVENSSNTNFRLGRMKVLINLALAAVS